jgi:hypothetical protein
MIGRTASDLFDKVAQCAAGPNEKDFKEIRKLLAKMEHQVDEITEEEFRYYADDFLAKWKEHGALEKDFELFASETNEIVLEFGNEGFFDELDKDDDF